jgi:hypothetical protein
LQEEGYRTLRHAVASFFFSQKDNVLSLTKQYDD